MHIATMYPEVSVDQNDTAMARIDRKGIDWNISRKKLGGVTVPHPVENIVSVVGVESRSSLVDERNIMDGGCPKGFVCVVHHK